MVWGQTADSNRCLAKYFCMLVAIGGKYSAPTQQEREKNLAILRALAAQVQQLGHSICIGLDFALPAVDGKSFLKEEDRYAEIMRISLEKILECDAFLLASESRGALMEKDAMEAAGKPIYFSVDMIPDNNTLDLE